MNFYDAKNVVDCYRRYTKWVHPEDATCAILEYYSDIPKGDILGVIRKFESYSQKYPDDKAVVVTLYDYI